MKTRARILIALTCLALVGCGAGSAEWTPLPSGAEPPAACARADPDGVIAFSADQLRFSAPCIVVPAGVAVVVRFTNNDSEPHNVEIARDRSKADYVTKGVTITGPIKSIDYPVEALVAGEYYFECSVHPAEMNGALYVR